MAGQVGVSYAADGTQPAAAPRLGQHLEAIVQQAHGKYKEAAVRGNMYAGCNITARSPGTALSTTAPLVLYNPVGSGKRLILKKVTVAQAATGTLGAGVLHHCGFTINGPTATQSNVIPTGTARTPSNLDLGGGANASVATLLENCTLNAAPVALYPFAAQNDAVAQTTAAPINTAYEDVDGAIVLEPGGGYTVEGISTGSSSPLIYLGMVWEEEPIAA
jgi:hypothetical protein